jgi:serine/threonine protein kinase
MNVSKIRQIIFDQEYEIIGNQLGNGTAASVYQIRSLKNPYGNDFVLKRFNPRRDKKPLTDVLQHEFSIINGLKHPYLISYHEMVSYTLVEYVNNCPRYMTYYGIIMDLVNGIDMEKYVYLHHPIGHHTIELIITQLLMVLSYLHKNNVLHGDVSPKNMIFNELEQKITLIDLDLSRRLTSTNEMKTIACASGTPIFMAPEILSYSTVPDILYNRQDVWSLGVSIYFFLTKVTPFDAKNINELKIAVNRRVYKSLDSAIPAHLHQIVHLCMAHDVYARLSIDDLIGFWFNKIKMSNSADDMDIANKEDDFVYIT